MSEANQARATERAAAARKIQQARRERDGAAGGEALGPRAAAPRGGAGAKVPRGARKKSKEKVKEPEAPSLFGDLMQQLDGIMLPINVEVRYTRYICYVLPINVEVRATSAPLAARSPPPTARRPPRQALPLMRQRRAMVQPASTESRTDYRRLSAPASRHLTAAAPWSCRFAGARAE